MPISSWPGSTRGPSAHGLDPWASTPWGGRYKGVDTRIKSAQDDFNSFPWSSTQVIIARKFSPDRPAACGERIGVRGHRRRWEELAAHPEPALRAASDLSPQAGRGDEIMQLRHERPRSRHLDSAEGLAYVVANREAIMGQGGWARRHREKTSLTRRRLLQMAGLAGTSLAMPSVRGAHAAEGANAKGKMVLAWHSNIAARWLDPQQYEGAATPYNFMMALQSIGIRSKLQVMERGAFRKQVQHVPCLLRSGGTERPGLRDPAGDPGELLLRPIVPPCLHECDWPAHRRREMAGHVPDRRGRLSLSLGRHPAQGVALG